MAVDDRSGFNTDLDRLKHAAEDALNHYTFQVVRNPTGGNSWFTREISVHTLAVQPESVVYAPMNRVAVSQTLGGVFVDMFGAGLTQINISGTTGRKGRRVGLKMMTGMEQVLHLKRNIYQASMTLETVLDTQGAGAGFSFSLGNLLSRIGRPGHGYPMVYFYDWAMNEAGIVIILNMTAKKSISRNKLYEYSISMIKVGEIDDEIFSMQDPLLNVHTLARRFGVYDAINAGFEAASYVGGVIDLVGDIGDLDDQGWSATGDLFGG